MSNLSIVKNFIVKNEIDNKNINKLYSKVNIPKENIIKMIFDILNQYIYNLSFSLDSSLYKYMNNCVNAIYYLCNEQRFDDETTLLFRKRIKKTRESILAYANKYNDNELLEIANKLDEIVLDKDLNANELKDLLIILINRKEDVNIIKKLLNTNKSIIHNTNYNLFDYIFNEAINAINNDTNDIYYYITLLKIFYSTKIDTNYYLGKLYDVKDNEYTREIIAIVNGNKRSLTPEEVLDKYGIKKPQNIELIIPPLTSTYNQTILTIDDDKTKLRDDGLSIKKIGSHYLVGIHIADGGKYVKYNSEIDLTARSNFKNSYIIRTLPKGYEKALSLDSNNTKSVISLYVIMNDSGEILDYYIKENDLLVAQNLSFLQADNILNRKNREELKNSLTHLFVLSKALEDKNQKKKQFYEEKSKKDETISFKSNLIIREFMILYNTLLGVECNDKSLPYVYRYQNTQYITRLTKEMGFSFDKKMQKEINNIYLNSNYSTTPRWHCGINSPIYTQSCNPLRKYPDLYNQYLLHKFLFKDKDFNFTEEEFNNMVNYFNQRSSEISLMKEEYQRALRLKNH